MYWGKIIGTVAGLATLKPWFALLGLFLGHQFDKGFISRYRDFEKQGRAMGRVSDDFVRALFRTMGHLAKADGRVTEDEIRAARMVMHRLGLSPAQVRRAIAWFDDGKRPGFLLQQTVRTARRDSVRSAAKRTMFLRLLLEVVLAKDSLASEERTLLWTICNEFPLWRIPSSALCI